MAGRASKNRKGTVVGRELPVLYQKALSQAGGIADVKSPAYCRRVLVLDLDLSLGPVAGLRHASLLALPQPVSPLHCAAEYCKSRSSHSWRGAWTWHF